MATPDIGTATREDRRRIDFARLRAARRERVFAAMERLDLDACLFGRETNGRYAAGQRRLWTSNTRAYMPTCVAVRSTGKVHVMAIGASTEDAPEDLPAEDAYGRSFDPAKLFGIYASLPGLAEARRIGVDGLSIGMRTLLGRICPRAEVVGAEPMMRELRRVKLPAEIDCLRVAITIAESSLQRAADLVSADVSGRTLLAAYLERMAELGTTTFAQQGTFRVANATPAPPFGVEDALLGESVPVVLVGGAQWAGYEGSLARTWWSGPGAPTAASASLHRRWRSVIERLVQQCRAGRNGHDLVQAYEESGEALPRMPIAYSVGMGHEGPVAGSGLGSAFDVTRRLENGMVVAVRAWVTDDTRGFLGEEVVHVREGAPEILTTMSHGAIGRAGEAR